MPEKRCILVGAGAHYESDIITPCSDDYVIAVDGGYDHLKEKGITPDLILGDFDSACIGSLVKEKVGLSTDTWIRIFSCRRSEDVSNDRSLPNIDIKLFPSKKDYTDMFLAVEEGFAKGYRTFLIYGGMGKRFDHTYANIQLLSYISEHGGRGFMYGDGCVLTAITDDTLHITADKESYINIKKDGYISVFSLSDVSTGISIIGLKYTADNITLTRNESVGTSNEYLKSYCKISVSHGTLLIVSSV